MNRIDHASPLTHTPSTHTPSTHTPSTHSGHVRAVVVMLVALAIVSLGTGNASLVAAQTVPEQAASTSATETTATDAPATNATVTVDQAELSQMRESLARLSAEVEELKATQADADTHDTSSDDAAINALMHEAEASEMAAAFQPSLSLYGWSELGLQRAWGGLNQTGLVGTDAFTFLTRTNLYIDAYPAPNTRVLTELRLGLFPDGSRDLGYAPIDTTVTDISSPYGGLAVTKWSGVILERAHADWTPSDHFNIRAGLFLTPYGIWNVDHGAPTRIMLAPPTFILFGLLPERQLGLEAFGTFAALPWTIGYHAYVSNGRGFTALGRASVSSDPTDNKAVGGRLFLRTRQPYPFTLGVSGYSGSFEVVDTKITLRPDRVESVERTVVALTEHALAFDVSADFGPLRLRSEVVLRWVIYEDGHREPSGPSATAADTLQCGAYMMAAYQLPWYGIEPVVMLEVMRLPSILGEGGVIPSVGINFYLTPTLTLRTQYLYAKLLDFSSPRDLPQSYNHFLTARFIAAF